MIAAAFIAAWATATAFWFGVGGVIWKLFFLPRLKALEEQLSDERKECDRQLTAMGHRINQLETMLMLHGPQALRQAMQAGLSEHSLAIDQIKRGAE